MSLNNSISNRSNLKCREIRDGTAFNNRFVPGLITHVVGDTKVVDVDRNALRVDAISRACFSKHDDDVRLHRMQELECKLNRAVTIDRQLCDTNFGILEINFLHLARCLERWIYRLAIERFKGSE